jgi:hypothetical protein
MDHKSPIGALDREFQGTPLGWGLYGWGGDGPKWADRRGYYEVAKLLADAGGTASARWLDASSRGLAKKVEEDAEMRAAVGSALRP